MTENKVPNSAYGNIPTEADEQKALFRWADAARCKYPELELMHHIVNEGRRDGRTGYNLRLMGMKRGVPDVCLPVARGGFHGLYVEMKRVKGGRPSPEQYWWREKLREQGYRAEICYGWEDAARVIREYLDNGQQV